MIIFLQAVFADMGSSSRALDIISKFAAVSSRIVIKEALHRCTLVAFSKYSVELEGIQAAYEKNKVEYCLFKRALCLLVLNM